MKLTEIVYYPVKSMRGIAAAEAEISQAGLPYDREWLLADTSGKFVTARKLPELLLWSAKPFSDGLTLTAPDGSSREIRTVSLNQEADVQVWKDVFSAHFGDEETDAWLSAKLGMPVRLHYLGSPSSRILPHTQTPLSFADGAPYLLTSQASLDAFNGMLDMPVEMRRFRPNLVIDGSSAWVEEGWKRIRIGTVEFEIFKPCVRCVMTTVDLATARKAPDQEPLSTLAIARNAIFGVNMTALGNGSVSVGDEVQVLA
ncbi:MOSC domain-containing protein [Neisseria sp.]|uniref:MOSC domain-containing protein n=1 Tax=Neisseria sp. TaxID=192066 RepID=UPI00359FBED7